MLVYGDHRETVEPVAWLQSLARQIAAVAAMEAGIARHAALVRALVEAGQLLQGLADAGAATGAVGELVDALAGAAVRSWDSGFETVGPLPRIAAGELPERAELRVPEGFAFYAVYPEAYAEAARKLRLAGPPRVIGIRSIGTTLGAIVADALGAPPAITVRPRGDPFARQVVLPPGAVERGAHYVVVDEGPGLSGSSFGAVADALEARGVAPERIAFVPSHGGAPGPQASEAHRARWAKAQKVAAAFDPGFLEERFGPLEPFAAGNPGERLKYRGTLDGEPVLLKFAGLGAIGARKLAMAQRLHEQGFTTEPLGLVHGFLVERWIADARPLAPGEAPVREIGRYIGTRARLFPAEGGSGAEIATLLAMGRRNCALALGDGAARAFDQWDAEALEARVQRVRIDGRLDRAEWLRTRDGRLLKTDALDHHCAHDLVGCQDMAWDVAGAIVEFDLDDAQADALIDAAEQAGSRAVDRALLDFHQFAYCGFRLGAATLGGDAGAAARYAAVLHHLLPDRSSSAASPRNSSID